MEGRDWDMLKAGHNGSNCFSRKIGSVFGVVICLLCWAGVVFAQDDNSGTNPDEKKYSDEVLADFEPESIRLGVANGESFHPMAEAITGFENVAKAVERYAQIHSEFQPAINLTFRY